VTGATSGAASARSFARDDDFPGDFPGDFLGDFPGDLPGRRANRRAARLRVSPVNITQPDEPQRPTRTSARATPVPEPETTLTESTPPKPRGRFASMTIEELQTKYLEVVGRSTGSDDRRYLIWKIREAEKGRINVGPRKTRAREGEPLDVKILPLRLEADVADKMDEAWRAKGIKNRMEFLRGAIGHYLAHLGARDAAALFTNADTTGA
jgi:hypothetical protein